MLYKITWVIWEIMNEILGTFVRPHAKLGPEWMMGIWIRYHCYQTQYSSLEPWQSEVEHANSLSLMLIVYLSFLWVGFVKTPYFFET